MRNPHALPVRSTLIALALLPALLAAADAPGPFSADGSLEAWPWQLEYEAVVVDAAPAKPSGVRTLTLTLDVVPRPGRRETRVDDRSAMVDARVGATIADDLQPATQVWFVGARFDHAKLAKGQRVRLWCCTSAAPGAPGWVLEVIPPPREPRRR